MPNLSRRRFIQAAATTAVAAALPLIHTRSAMAADPLKIGYIYVGPINDGGWKHRSRGGAPGDAEGAR